MNYRLKWSQQEEHLLRTFGGSQKKNKWTLIAKMINDKLPAFHKTPKQCRQKYNNHLMFSQNNYDLNWTIQQEAKLFKEYAEKGSKWKLLSQSFPTKSQNTIKNKFYGNIRKIVRKLNKVGKQKISRSLKPIRQKSIIRIIQPEVYSIQTPIQIINSIKNLRIKILDLLCNFHSIQTKQNLNIEMQNQCEFNCMNYEQIVNIIKEIHLFNSRCRFYTTKKDKGKEKLKNSPCPSQQLSDQNQHEGQSQEAQSQQNSQEQYPFQIIRNKSEVKQEKELAKQKLISYSINSTQNQHQNQHQIQQLEHKSQKQGEVCLNGGDMVKQVEMANSQKSNIKNTQKQRQNNNVFSIIKKCLLDYCQNHDRELLFLFNKNEQLNFNVNINNKGNKRYNLRFKNE